MFDFFILYTGNATFLLYNSYEFSVLSVAGWRYRIPARVGAGCRRRAAERSRKFVEP
jgi:hypothetical protein